MVADKNLLLILMHKSDDLAIFVLTTIQTYPHAAVHAHVGKNLSGSWTNITVLSI